MHKLVTTRNIIKGTTLITNYSTEIVFHVFDGQTLIAIGDAPVILGRFSGEFAVSH